MQGRGDKYVIVFLQVVLLILSGCSATRKTGKTPEAGTFIKYRNLRVYSCNEGEELFRGYINADPERNFRMTVITRTGIVAGRIYAVDTNIYIVNSMGRKYYSEELTDQMWNGLGKLIFGPSGKGTLEIKYNNERNIFNYEVIENYEKDGKQMKVEWNRKSATTCWNIKIGSVVSENEGKMIIFPVNFKENYRKVNKLDEVFQ